MVILEEIIKKHQDGTILNIFVITDSSINLFPARINEWRKCIEIKVKSPAVDNKANKEVKKIVANFFKKSINDIFIITGTKNSKKKVFIKGVTVGLVSDKLRESLGL